MSDLNPSETARHALRELASRKLAPTPDNFAAIYHEIAGSNPNEGTERAALVRELREHIARTIERSRLGYGFAAIRDDEQAAEAAGVPTLRLKLVATTLSGALISFFTSPDYARPEPATVRRGLERDVTRAGPGRGGATVSSGDWPLPLCRTAPCS